jgi:hypothetical protein
MLHQIFQGKTQTELQALVGTQLECIQTHNQVIITEYADDFWTGTERFEGFRVTYPDGMTHVISKDRVGKDYLPHTFVLADLFDVETMTLDVPDCVYESDPSLEWVTCPACEGAKWVEVEGSAWHNPAWLFHNFSSLKPCERCGTHGEVLAALNERLAISSLEPLGKERNIHYAN